MLISLNVFLYIDSFFDVNRKNCKYFSFKIKREENYS